MTAATGVLQGNLIAAADSDFEAALTGNWTAGSNTTITARSAFSFTGASAMQLKATASGSVAMTYAAIPVSPANPAQDAPGGYTFSGWVQDASSGRTATVAVAWKNSGGSTISTATSSAVTLTAGAYTPVELNAPAPAAAVTAIITWTVSGLSANETVQLDTLYAATMFWQVLAAWTSPPLSTSPLWADMTPWLRLDQGISYSRSRPDETQQPQPGTAGCTFDNTTGFFVDGTSPWPLTIGTRLRFNAADEAGSFHNRSDAYITDLDPGWTGANAAESIVACSASDLLARLTRAPSMRTMIEQEILLDSPLVLYSLSDPSGSTMAQDSSGNGAAPLEIQKLGSGATRTNNKPAFGSGTGIIGALAPGFTGSGSPLQTCLFTTSTPQASYQLQGFLPSPVSVAAGFAVEIWCDLNTSQALIAQNPVCVANSKTAAFLGPVVMPGNEPTGPDIYATWQASPSVSAVNSGGSSSIPSPLQHLVVSVSGTTATLYVNGVSKGTLTVAAAAAFDTLIVAGAPGNLPATGIGLDSGGVTGSLCLAVVYPAPLSSGRVAAHWSAGSAQNFGDTIAALAGNILTYTGIPAAMQSLPSPGVSYADAYEITGQTPMSVLQLYQQVDGGVVFMTGAGNVKFGDRAARYAAVASPALTLAAGQYSEQLRFPKTDQFLINDATYANNNMPGGVRSVNAASVLASSDYPSGDPLSPTTGPWYSYPWDPSLATADGDVLGDATAWTVSIYGTPVPRSPNLILDLATLPASAFSRAQAYGVDCGSVVVLDGLPATAPSGSPLISYLMAEGVAESFTQTSSARTWTLTFNTSPASASAAWVPGDTVMGVLDSTAVIGRGTDGSPNGGNPRYAGPPYPAPVFSGTMNRTGNVGANDMRGIWANVQQAITPPCFALQQVNLAQSIPNNNSTDLQWDVAWYDTANGFSEAGSLVVYTVQLPGLYKLRACIPFGASATGDRRAYFQQNGSEVAGRASIAAVVGSDYVSLFIAATVECAAGDTLKVTCFQLSGGALVVPTTNGGAVWSGVFRGN